MANSYYNVSGSPVTGSAGASAVIRSEYANIAAAFDKMPALTASTAVVVNAGGTALSNTVGTLALAGNFATTGAFATTLVAGAATSLTLPLVSGTLATLAGTEELTNKTLTASVAKGTWTVSGTWTVPAVTVSGVAKAAQLWQSSRNAYTNFVGSTPGTIASATKLMLGLGSSWALTPSFSGRVRIKAVGYVETNVSGGNINLSYRFGTGAAPANNAALAGTAFTTKDMISTAAGAGGPWGAAPFEAEVTGLTLSTAYWFDVAAGADAGTLTYNSVSVIIEEF